MLDRASIERLAKTPEKNDPMLNVALAEEGAAPVLMALARSRAVGPEAIAVIAARAASEGANVGLDAEAQADGAAPIIEELDRLLAAHPRAPADVRDAVLARHPGDAFFVLAAASHASATSRSIEAAIDWPSASPVHDRLWLALLDPAAVPQRTIEAWATDPGPLRREAAAKLARDASLCARLAADPSRQVRRAIASNRHAGEARRGLARDPAPEVRSRAEAPLAPHAEGRETEGVVDTARFAAALRAMAAGGVLAPDVARSLAASPAGLDDEGARIAAEVLPRAELAGVVQALLERGARSPAALSLAAGLALRRPVRRGAEHAGDAASELAEIVYDAVKALSRAPSGEERLTGKARLAAWAAEGLASCPTILAHEILVDLGRGAIGSERMILARGAARRPSIVGELAIAARGGDVAPAALVELAWADRSVDDALVVDLAGRIPKPKARADDLPEDEVDLDPSDRSLDVLERAVMAATRSANVSPRSALAVVALDSRRVRYVLSAMAAWKGRLSGGRLARILRQNAGALSAGRAEGRARAARVEGWTERIMSETEMAIALAVGHLTGAEVAKRIASGRQAIDDGLTIACGAEARAAVEGPEAVLAILAWASKNRSETPAALAIWLLLERFDRARAPTLVGSAVDGLSAAKAGVPASVCDALALLERRSPGRLESVHCQSPRGRATLASAIARAYRGIGGMRDERQDP